MGLVDKIRKYKSKVIFVDLDNTLYKAKYPLVFYSCGEGKINIAKCFLIYLVSRLLPPLRDKTFKLYKPNLESLEHKVKNLIFNEKLIEKLKEYRDKGYEIVTFTAEPKEVTNKVIEYIKEKYNLEIKPYIYTTKDKVLYTIKDKIKALKSKFRGENYIIIDDKCNRKIKNCYKPEEFTD